MALCAQTATLGGWKRGPRSHAHVHALQCTLLSSPFACQWEAAGQICNLLLLGATPAWLLVYALAWTALQRDRVAVN